MLRPYGYGVGRLFYTPRPLARALLLFPESRITWIKRLDFTDIVPYRSGRELSGSAQSVLYLCHPWF